jgi:hypothetical protein
MQFDLRQINTAKKLKLKKETTHKKTKKTKKSKIKTYKGQQKAFTIKN